MSDMTDYLEGQLRAHLFRTASFAKPSVLALALCTADPTDAATGASCNEVANAGAYARQVLNPLDANWSAPDATGGVTRNQSIVTFPQATASWGTVTHFVITDSATYGAGNVLIKGTLTVSKLIGNGDQFKFPVDSLTVTFA